MSTYRLKILSPEKALYEGDVISITVPGAGGLLTVLSGHESMAALLKTGPLIIRTAENTLEAEIGPAFLSVSQNEAVLLGHAFRWTKDE